MQKLVSKKFWNLPQPDVRITDKQLMEFIKPIQGWGTREDYFDLYRLSLLCPADSYILELGSHIGKSATVMLLHSQVRRLILSDLWDGYLGLDTYYECVKNMVPYEYRIKMVKGDNSLPEIKTNILSHIGARPYGLLYVDADHTYESVKRDIANYVEPLVPLYDVVAFHDYNSDHPQVVHAIEDLIKTGNWKPESYSGRVITLRRLA